MGIDDFDPGGWFDPEGIADPANPEAFGTGSERMADWGAEYPDYIDPETDDWYALGTREMQPGGPIGWENPYLAETERTMLDGQVIWEPYAAEGLGSADWTPTLADIQWFEQQREAGGMPTYRGGTQAPGGFGEASTDYELWWAMERYNRMAAARQQWLEGQVGAGGPTGVAAIPEGATYGQGPWGWQGEWLPETVTGPESSVYAEPSARDPLTWIYEEALVPAGEWAFGTGPAGAPPTWDPYQPYEPGSVRGVTPGGAPGAPGGGPALGSVETGGPDAQRFYDTAQGYATVAPTLYNRDPLAADWNRANLPAGLATAAINDQRSNLQSQGRNLRYLDLVQRGEAGPSLAELQQQRGIEDANRALLSASQSGPGYNPAAQVAAMRSGEEMQRRGIMDASMLRAAEQEAARGQYLGGLGQYGQAATATGAAALGLYGEEAGRARYDVESAITQRQQDTDAYLRMLGLEGGMMGMGLTAETTAAELGAAEAERAQDYQRFVDEMMVRQNLAQLQAGTARYGVDVGAHTARQGAAFGAAGSLMEGFGDWVSPDDTESDERSKEKLEAADAQIADLTRQLQGQGGGNPWTDALKAAGAELQGQAQAAPESGAYQITMDPQGQPRYKPLTGNEVDDLVGTVRRKEWLAEVDEEVEAQKRRDARGPSMASRVGESFYDATVGEAQRQMTGEGEKGFIRGAWDEAFGPDAGAAATEAVQNPDPLAFQYTDEARQRNPGGTAPGQRYGLTAQQLAQTPAGATAVNRRPDGSLGVDTDQLAILDALSIGSVADRVDELERQQGRRRPRYG
jgi:hypothetical protein